MMPREIKIVVTTVCRIFFLYDFPVLVNETSFTLKYSIDCVAMTVKLLHTQLTALNKEENRKKNVEKLAIIMFSVQFTIHDYYYYPGI